MTLDGLSTCLFSSFFWFRLLSLARMLARFDLVTLQFTYVLVFVRMFLLLSVSFFRCGTLCVSRAFLMVAFRSTQISYIFLE